MTIQDQLFYRTFEVHSVRVDNKNRSVDVAFSSAQPVRRWFGKEILLHGAENVNLHRLRVMGSALMNHNADQIIGRIKNVRIEDKRGRATIIFDDDDDGNRAFGKVRSGSLRGVSVGYMIEKARKVKEDEECEGIRGPALIALRWTPYEISLTPLPADASVGVGRDLTQSLDGIDIEPIIKGESEMDREQVKQIFNEMFAHKINEMTSRELGWKVSYEQASSFLSRAEKISLDAKMEIGDMISAGHNEVEISGRLLDLALNNNAQVIDKDNGRRLSFDQIEDRDFFRALTSPLLLSDAMTRDKDTEIDTKSQGQSEVSSFSQVDDITFLRGLCSPNL